MFGDENLIRCNQVDLIKICLNSLPGALSDRTEKGFNTENRYRTLLCISDFDGDIEFEIELIVFNTMSNFYLTTRIYFRTKVKNWIFIFSHYSLQL